MIWFVKIRKYLCVFVVRYKQQLSSGLKREKALEQLQVQKELEWQRRCEELKSAHYLANEQLLQDLTQARDQVSHSLHITTYMMPLCTVCGWLVHQS